MQYDIKKIAEYTFVVCGLLFVGYRMYQHPSWDFNAITIHPKQTYNHLDEPYTIIIGAFEYYKSWLNTTCRNLKDIPKDKPTTCLHEKMTYFCNVWQSQILKLRVIKKIHKPSTKATTIAWVYEGYPIIFINYDPNYTTRSIQQIMITLFHEHLHIILHLKDYAYSWSENFIRLTEKEHCENADSFVNYYMKELLIM